jgi:glucose dehydrogenase
MPRESGASSNHPLCRMRDPQWTPPRAELPCVPRARRLRFTPNDPYDFDANWELINADIDVAGVKRKVLMQLNRNGFLYVLDRTNGGLISAKPYGKVNWASHIDPETGRPVETEVGKKLRGGEQIEMWPSTRGAKNWPHAAFSPETGLLYANTMHRGGIYKHLAVKPRGSGSATSSSRTARPRSRPARRSPMWRRSIRSPASRNGACR